MWTDGNQMIADHDAYIAPDGTQYPGNFPKDQIPGLVLVPPPPPPEPPTPEEIAAQEAAQAIVNAERIKENIISSTQDRLDVFARTRNYDNILSACTYATSSITKFKLEGQYCVDIRDQTWATLYQILEDVQDGIRTMPTDYQEVEPLLPVLVWPT